MQEQASFGLLYTAPPQFRKFAMRLLFAGHRFVNAAQQKHAFRCYAFADGIYSGRDWVHIDSRAYCSNRYTHTQECMINTHLHIHVHSARTYHTHKHKAQLNTSLYPYALSSKHQRELITPPWTHLCVGADIGSVLARQSFLLQRMDSARQYMQKILENNASSSLATQAAQLREYLHIVSSVPPSGVPAGEAATPPLPELPFPQILTDSIRVFLKTSPVAGTCILSLATHTHTHKRHQLVP